MLHRHRVRLWVFAVVSAMVLSSVAAGAQGNSDRRGRKYKAPPASSRIEVTILRNDNGKPIENAAVIFHPIENDRDKGGMELKTNEEGKATIDVIPIGDTVRLQVIANGFQTYGKDYKVDKASMAMEVKLHRPAPEYSIYKENNSASGSSGQDSGTQKNANSSKDGNTSNDKSSGSGSQQKAPPNPN